MPQGAADVDTGERLAAGAPLLPPADIERPAWSRVRDAESAMAPGLRPPASFAHNLPVQLTSFVGREPEMAQVRALLAGSRLVTLTGALESLWRLRS